MKHFTIVTCLWKRHELSHIVLGFYARQRIRLAAAFAELGFEVDFLAVGSEGAASRFIAEDAGWPYAEHDNQPLSNKWNFACAEAVRRGGANVLFIVGSDDLCSDTYMLKVASMMADGADLAGALDCYLVSPRLRRGLHIMPTRHTDNSIIGAGRAVSRRAFDMAQTIENVADELHARSVHPGPGLYEPGRAWGIDPTMDRRLKAIGIEQQSFVLADVPRAMLVDVKTSENIWPFIFFRDMGLPESYEEVLAHFDEGTRLELDALRDDGSHEFDEHLDPMLHRIAAALMSLLVDRPDPIIVEVGRKWDFWRKLQEAIPQSQYVPKCLEEELDCRADVYVLFDGDLTVEEQLEAIRKMPHNARVMLAVPQEPFSDYEEAERRYGALLASFSIKVIGRWWLGCGTRVDPPLDIAEPAAKEIPERSLVAV